MTLSTTAGQEMALATDGSKRKVDLESKFYDLLLGTKAARLSTPPPCPLKPRERRAKLPDDETPGGHSRLTRGAHAVRSRRVAAEWS